jgi:hypothetical protein
VFICFPSLVIDVCVGIVVAEASIATGMGGILAWGQEPQGVAFDGGWRGKIRVAECASPDVLKLEYIIMPVVEGR